MEPSTPLNKGRKPVKIDLSAIEGAASIGCTLEEIGAIVGLSGRQVQRRQSNLAFNEAIERGRAKGRATLRRWQWRAAEQGNVTALIWLGKQMLGQRSFEKPEPEAAEAPPPLVINTYVVADADQPNAPPDRGVQQPGEIPGPGSGKKVREDLP